MEWISVKDRLPERYIEVLVYPRPMDFALTADYGYDSNKNLGWRYYEYENGFGVVSHKCNPTHWMPLPPPPKGE